MYFRRDDERLQNLCPQYHLLCRLEVTAYNALGMFVRSSLKVGAAIQ